MGSETLLADATSKLHILWHECDALAMDGLQNRVFKEANQVRLGIVLERLESGRVPLRPVWERAVVDFLS